MWDFIWVIVCSLLALCAHAIDPFDPQGNVTITWDILRWAEDDGYVAAVTIQNHQLYRRIEAEPGWSLGWEWAKDEVIWSVRGAQAISQGDCARVRKLELPHSCEHKPVMVDLMPGVSNELRTANCCRSGGLSSTVQDPASSVAYFEMTIGFAKRFDPDVPRKFVLGRPVPGYSCTNAELVAPSLIPDGSQRQRQALRTWKLSCVYSQRKAPCCVSLSSFYNPHITPCPECACDCSIKLPTAPDMCTNNARALPGSNGNSYIQCSKDMCPIHVHWHIKNNYKKYWRAKVTITNRNARNYTQWNLVIQHPNINRLSQAFSFNSKSLPLYKGINDTVVLWGMSYYNEMLLEAGENGTVQSEILFGKDSSFTLRKGWAFPHKVLFNGDECVLPSPDTYPALPSSATQLPTGFFLVIILVFMYIPE